MTNYLDSDDLSAEAYGFHQAYATSSTTHPQAAQPTASTPRSYASQDYREESSPHSGLPSGSVVGAASTSIGGPAPGSGTWAVNPLWTPRSVQDMGISDKINQGQFDYVAIAHQQGVSTATSLRNLGLYDIPPSTAFDWLQRAGVLMESTKFRVKPLMSAAQFEIAEQAQKQFIIDKNGKTHGSVMAAYRALGSDAPNKASFEKLLSQHGWTPSGQNMKNRALAYAAHHEVGNPD
jgi:hypothetical protein